MGLEDDVIYLAILVATCTVAHISKHRLIWRSRDQVNAAAGLILVLAVSGWQVLYSLFLVIGTLLLIRAAPPRRLFLSSLVWAFGYLTFTRLADRFGLPPLLPHANAVQLIMTLRVVGMSSEVADLRSAGTELPSFTQLFLYCYNSVGLFTGPYYTLRTHLDMVTAEHLETIPVRMEVERRLLVLPVYIVGFLGLARLFPLETLKTPSFYEETGWLWRILYSFPVFHTLKLRMYTAWQLAELAAVANGLGVYPASSQPRCVKGPTQPLPDDLTKVTDWSYETIRNVDPYRVELSRGFRTGMRAWNRSVQSWLATYIYARAPKSIRLVLTMGVSALWHGLHFGYAVSFLTIPLATAAEDPVLPFLSPLDDQGCDVQVRTPLDGVWWVFRQWGFTYMAMGFLLLSYANTLTYYASIGFFFHVLAAAVVAFFAVRGRKAKEN